MSRRFVLTPVLIVFTLLSSLGESLHALPGLSHSDDSAACHVRTEHMETPVDEHHDDCSICHLSTGYQFAGLERSSVGPIVVTSELHLTDRFEIDLSFIESHSARAPPIG
jgi:hypothetical protein